MRVYKNVTGKCKCCATLHRLYQSFRGPKYRELINKLAQWHRHSIMSEKKEYYQRRAFKGGDPNYDMSIIGDGMSQSHCSNPHLGNLAQIREALEQHLQGVIEHGVDFTIFRTFCNVTNGANLNIFCFLYKLERFYERNGRYPENVAWQIDGGPENCNEQVIAMCELVVANGMAKKIVLTRLPVGHTHEDIDGRFGNMWDYFKLKDIYTPDEYLKVTITPTN